MIFYLVIGITFWLLVLVVYFIPTIIARQRKHQNFLGILVVNFFLGWTLLGWVGALVWALVKSPQAIALQHSSAFPPPHTYYDIARQPPITSERGAEFSDEQAGV